MEKIKLKKIDNPDDVIYNQLVLLRILVNNMFIEDRNIKSGYYFNHDEYKLTRNYVNVIKSSAEHVIRRIESILEMVD